ncbi:MAG: YHYH domain-containing protein [Gammaproteobacteria bacterium]|nr:YHYH domain-containing protein [Gammaproteobacteria bacterium]
MIKAISIGLVSILLAASTIGSTYAHSGGLNQKGCHNNHKTGGYHCHR